MKQFNNLNRMFAVTPKAKAAPKSRLEIHWSNGQVTQITKKGSSWSWSTPEGYGEHLSSSLHGIKDELAYRDKYHAEAGLLCGKLVRVPV